MKLIFTMVLMMESVAWGQQPSEVNPPQTAPVRLAGPVNCSKYQHVEYESCPAEAQRCPLVTTGQGAYHCDCIVQQKSYCADDLHTVTEKEWQAQLYLEKTQQAVNKALQQFILADLADRKKILQRLDELEGVTSGLKKLREEYAKEHPAKPH